MTDRLFDLAIVGGGPAGQAAAEQAIGAGLSVVMIDEQARMGGQILRQPPSVMRVKGWMDGRPYRALKRQLARAEALEGLTWLGRTSVIGALPGESPAGGFVLLTAATDGTRGGRVLARRLLVAAGCYDLPAPLPGWTTPGVMSAGAIQAFMKSQQLVPGERFVLAGTHPLQLVLADQIMAAGGQVVELLFGQALSSMARGLATRPLVAFAHARVLIEAAGCWFRLRRRGVSIRFGRTVVEAVGDGAVTGARLSDGRTLACDRIGLCFGFLPQADLPRSLGAASSWAPGAGGWATRADAWRRTDLEGLYVAGETTGVAGALAAMEEGRIAGLAVALDAGVLSRDVAERGAKPARRRLSRLLGLARLLEEIASPAGILEGMSAADTVICRCEDVTRAEIEAALQGPAASAGPSGVKLVSRAGMGLCQGRGCEAAVLRLMAAGAGAPPDALGGFTPRWPIRPTPIANLKT